MDLAAWAPRTDEIPPDARIWGLSKQSGIEALDGWHLKVRAGERAAELAAEKSSLRSRQLEGSQERI